MYTTYLALLSQLLSQNEARIKHLEKKISVIVDPQKNRWTLSSKIFNPPNYLIECLLPGKRLRWDSKWAYLMQKDEEIYLTCETSPLRRYIQYKVYMEEFLKSLELFSERASQNDTTSPLIQGL